MLRSAVAWLVVLPFAVWALVRVPGWDPGWPTAQLLPFTPLVAAGAVVAVVFAVVLRRWGAAAVGVLSAVALVAVVAPRAIGSDDTDRLHPSEPRPRLRVLTLNLHGKGAEPSAVVALARRVRADVVSLQELTAENAATLRRAGLERAFPNTVLLPRPESAGTGLYSRLPLQSDGPLEGMAYAIATARVTLPGGREARVVSVHTQAPVGRPPEPRWNEDFRVLRRARSEKTPEILAGDFNATLDHPQLRDLLDAGYEDAADATGQGLTPTWPEHRRVPPVIAIDHVLASRGSGFAEVRIHTVAGSDHRAVFAEVLVPSVPY